MTGGEKEDCKRDAHGALSVWPQVARGEIYLDGMAKSRRGQETAWVEFLSSHDQGA